MAEYIELEEVVHLLMTRGRYLTKDLAMDAAYEVSKIPAADVAPVRHGRWDECDWVKYDGHSECIHYPKAAWRCSNCCNAFKKELLWKDNYCPNCGAKMDLEGENT